MVFNTINKELFKSLAKEAKASPRKRKNLNFHKDQNETVQRMLNALEPETYARPHRHPGRIEVFLCLAGRAAMIAFNDDGNVLEHVVLGPEETTVGVDVPADVWHTVISLAEGTIMYEVEPGPYNPDTAKEFAPWAPTEESGEGLLFNKKILDVLGIR